MRVGDELRTRTLARTLTLTLTLTLILTLTLTLALTLTLSLTLALTLTRWATSSGANARLRYYHRAPSVRRCGCSTRCALLGLG